MGRTYSSTHCLRGRLLKRARTAVSCAVRFSLLAASALALADSARFDIAAQPLPQALKLFAAQAHMQLLYQYNDVAKATGNAVSGDLEKHAALAHLLQNSGLEVIYNSDSAATIRAVRGRALSSEGATSAPSNEASPQSPDKQDTSAPSHGQTSPPSQGKTSSEPSVERPPLGLIKSDDLEEARVTLPEILIVGSPTMNTDVTRTEDDVQPYTIFRSEQIQQSGATNVEDFLKQQLTMNTAGATNSQANASAGVSPFGTTSSINLRGLGSNETLILIDGRRTAGVSIRGAGYQADINGIPLSAIERIEVLPSSASAIYGGAAVGGVVNIILKKSFSGGDFSYTYDKPESSSANKRTVSANYGISFDATRTQIMVGGQYSDESPLLLGDRLNLEERGVNTIFRNSPSYYNASNPALGAATNIASADGDYQFGPQYPQGMLFTPTPLTLQDGTPLNSPITSIPAGTGVGSNLAPGLLANAGKYNLSLPPGVSLNGLQSSFGMAALTKSLFTTIRQTLFDNVQLFTELSTSSNAGRAIINPFAVTAPIPAAAPDNPFQQDLTVSFPSNIAVPQTTDSVTQSATIGVVVPLAHGWSSEVDYTWSRNAFEFASYDTDPAFITDLSTGVLNPFVDTLTHPLNLTPYLAPTTYSGKTTLNDVTVRASGPIGSLPAGRPTLTVGVEHRKEASSDETNDINDPLTPAESQQQIFFGESQSTDSVYAEGLVPLIAARNDVPAIHSLDLQVAARSERYTVHAGTPFEYLSPVEFQMFNPPQGLHSKIEYTSTNPTIGLKYQPTADFTARASYSTAFLPPTPAQLLLNPTSTCPGVPCQVITDPKNGESYRVNESRGGNPHLQPQTSRDWDLGMIWAPQEEMLRGLRLDLEYYRITQPNYIENPTVQQAVNIPGAVTRDPTTGLITSVSLAPVNAAEYKTSGWDVKADYSKLTHFGIFGLRAAATFIKYDQRQLKIDGPFYEYAGFPNDGGEGKIKANATLSWEYRHWTATWTATYYSGYYQEFSRGSPSGLQNPGLVSPILAAQGANTIPSQIYHDIYMSYAFGQRSGMGSVSVQRGGTGDVSVSRSRDLVSTLLSNLTVSFGIRNVFNTLPPFDVYNTYFYSTYGDPRLREFRLTVKKSFH
jgi:iron complex outermembrane receptor protein